MQSTRFVYIVLSYFNLIDLEVIFILCTLAHIYIRTETCQNYFVINIFAYILKIFLKQWKLFELKVYEKVIFFYIF